MTSPESHDERQVLAQLRSRGIDGYVWEDPPGFSYPPHTHATPEFRRVTAGKLRIGFDGGGARTLKPGDEICVAADKLHWAQAGPSGARYVCWSEEDGATANSASPDRSGDSSGSPGP